MISNAIKRYCQNSTRYWMKGYDKGEVVARLLLGNHAAQGTLGRMVGGAVTGDLAFLSLGIIPNLTALTEGILNRCNLREPSGLTQRQKGWTGKYDVSTYLSKIERNFKKPKQPAYHSLYQG